MKSSPARQTCVEIVHTGVELVYASVQRHGADLEIDSARAVERSSLVQRL